MSDLPEGREAFQVAFNVSRETMEKFDAYEVLIRKWNRSINLVSRTTLDQVWSRHFHDSASAYDLAKINQGNWVDLGSGGGFPGAVIAIMAHGAGSPIQVTCIESDIRKCEFLRSLARTLNIKLNVLSRRIEDAPPQAANILSARALTSLSNLLGFAERHLAPDGHAIFLKGVTWQSELDEALESWRFSYEKQASQTHPDSVVLRIGEIERV